MPPVKVETKAGIIRLEKIVKFNKTPYAKMKARKGGHRSKERGTGLFAMTHEELVAAGRIGGRIGGRTAKERGAGIFAKSHEERVAFGAMVGRMFGSRGARRRNELYGPPGTPEGRRKGERNQPREAKVKGGRITKERGTGIFAPGMAAKGGSRTFELHGCLITSEGRCMGLCTRHHGRQRGEPLCPKCQAKLDAKNERP